MDLPRFDRISQKFIVITVLKFTFVYFEHFCGLIKNDFSFLKKDP